uniref:Uncharacterized protein n=1 Tax=Megaselia scalaris TaxID=36166 RepID=T1GG32_MEGSC
MFYLRVTPSVNREVNSNVVQSKLWWIMNFKGGSEIPQILNEENRGVQSISKPSTSNLLRYSDSLKGNRILDKFNRKAKRGSPLQTSR